MKLWTYQGDCFSLTDPNIKIDIKKSRYINWLPGYEEAHRKLSEEIGAKHHQIVFCYTEYEDRPDEALVLWELEVPENNLIPINTRIWNNLIEDKEKLEDYGYWLKLLRPSSQDKVQIVLQHPIEDSWVEKIERNPAKIMLGG